MPKQQIISNQSLPDIILGIGFTSKAQEEGIEDFIHARMKELGLEKISAIATLSKPVMPAFLQKLAESFGAVPVLHYAAAQLEQETLRLAHPSSVVYRAVGCHGVAEAAALCAAGRQARLILGKTACNGITFALAGGNVT